MSILDHKITMKDRIAAVLTMCSRMALAKAEREAWLVDNVPEGAIGQGRKGLMRLSAACGDGIAAVMGVAYFFAREEKGGRLGGEEGVRETIKNKAFMDKQFIQAGLMIAFLAMHTDGGEQPEDTFDLEVAAAKARKFYTALEDHGVV